MWTRQTKTEKKIEFEANWNYRVSDTHKAGSRHVRQQMACARRHKGGDGWRVANQRRGNRYGRAFERAIRSRWWR
jgi:hypothetical protein